jgi:mannose-6-phosphate isomerase-like protein (cupin superfamily)
MPTNSDETGPIENERNGREVLEGMRGGPGSVTVCHFRFDGNGAPTRFLILEIPPGAAEGSHVHYADDRNGMGAYEEFYYVISGRGLATLDNATYPVATGDYWHAPLNVMRGLANVDPAELLKVHLTVVLRDPV